MHLPAEISPFGTKARLPTVAFFIRPGFSEVGRPSEALAKEGE
jgi:hypothetical protein